jgi:hypothetical protein
MRAKSTLLALGLAAALQPALAGVVTLGFEQPSDWGKLTNQYAGQGVSFSGDAWAVGSALGNCNGDWLFARTGSCGGLLLGADPFDQPTGDVKTFTINVSGGFLDKFGFVFGQRSGANVAISVYDGLDGKGTELGTAGALNGGLCDEPSLRFCGDWPAGSVDFSGTARSVVISGFDQFLMLDDLRFTMADQPPGRLPEPASLALALSAVGALGWVRRRSAR